MRFDAKKCHILSTHSKSSHYYSFNNHILRQVDCSPYLGVTITHDLKWTTYINNIMKRASSTLGFLRRNLRFCPSGCKKTAYSSLVRSALEYSAAVCGTPTNKLTSTNQETSRGVRHASSLRITETVPLDVSLTR